MDTTDLLINLNEAHPSIQFTMETATNNRLPFIGILHFRIPHNTLCLPPKFCINHCFQMLLGVCSIPKSI